MAIVERPAVNGFNDISHSVEISDEDKEIGESTYYLFTQKLIRALPWSFKNGQITVDKKFDAFVQLETIPGETYIPDLRERVIVTDGLEKEQISPELARVITQFKMVEDFLPDFMARGTQLTRNNMGINMSYNQWGREELQHSLALGLILERTGNKTPQQLIEEYNVNLTRTWEIPFPTPRMILIYAAFQERNTDLAYRALEKRAGEEDAPITSKILKLIAKDEAYHGGGYRAFVKIYYERDPVGTLEDVAHVAKNYRMPAQNLHPNPKQALKDVLRVGAFTRELIAEDTIHGTLKGLGFVPNELAQEILQEYWSK